jgi:hypothetical protein
MKQMIMAVSCLLLTGMVFAQTDTTNEKTDTLTVGNFIILKKKTGLSETENNSRDEYRSGRSYNRRYYHYNDFREVPVVSKLVDDIVDAALNIGEYFSRTSLYDFSYLNQYNYRSKVSKTKKVKKQPHIIKINGDRYVLDKTDDKDSD